MIDDLQALLVSKLCPAAAAHCKCSLPLFPLPRSTENRTKNDRGTWE